MKKQAKTYSQRLTPEEVQRVFDSLNIPWRDYEPNSDGWITIDGEILYQSMSENENISPVCFNGRPSFNIYHGGFISHNDIGYAEASGYDFDEDHLNVKKTIKGDLVDLVCHVLHGFQNGTDKTKDAISFINHLLGKRGIDQKAFTGKTKAKDFIKKKLDIFVVVPKPLLQSKISASSKIIWCEIHDQCRKGKHCSWPSIATISKRTNISRSTVIRSLHELENHGFLVIQKKEGSNNLYFPVLPDNKINQCQNKTGVS